MPPIEFPGISIPDEHSTLLKKDNFKEAAHSRCCVVKDNMACFKTHVPFRRTCKGVVWLAAGFFAFVVNIAKKECPVYRPTATFQQILNSCWKEDMRCGTELNIVQQVFPAAL
jgi:hypothetical protein